MKQERLSEWKSMCHFLQWEEKLLSPQLSRSISYKLESLVSPVEETFTDIQNQTLSFDLGID